MTARVAEPIAVGRGQLFFGIFLVTTLNGFVGHGLRAIEERGVAGAAFALFGVSAILWVALAAGLAVLAEGRDREQLRPGDLGVALVAGAAALLPSPTASSLALSLVAIWAIASSGPGSTVRRAGIIFLAMSGALLWGRLLLAMFSRPLLSLDAIFVSTLLGAESRGNSIWIGDMWSGVVVAPGCSSMQGMSLALVFWATVNQFFKVPFGWKGAITCAAALAATVAVNVLRIGAMLVWPEHMPTIHHGWGYELSMWTTLVLVAIVCLLGARREVFVRR